MDINGYKNTLYDPPEVKEGTVVDVGSHSLSNPLVNNKLFTAKRRQQTNGD